MRRLMWISMALMCFSACKPKIPKEIIQPDKMQKVLYDIHIADGYIATINNRDSAKRVAAAYYKGIYKKFEIDSAAYNRSMKFYYKHPTELDLIYKNIAKQITRQKRKMEKTDSVNLSKLTAKPQIK